LQTLAKLIPLSSRRYRHHIRFLVDVPLRCLQIQKLLSYVFIVVILGKQTKKQQYVGDFPTISTRLTSKAITQLTVMARNSCKLSLLVIFKLKQGLESKN
jgi:hypothetical protein